MSHQKLIFATFGFLFSNFEKKNRLSSSPDIYFDIQTLIFLITLIIDHIKMVNLIFLQWFVSLIFILQEFPIHFDLFYLDLDEIEPNAFLGPFLEVIRSEDTTGPITGLALTSVNKFLSYGLVGKKSKRYFEVTKSVQVINADSN